MDRSTNKIRLLIVDSRPIVNWGLRLALKGEDDFILLGEARTPAEAVALSSTLRPNIVIMDMAWPYSDTCSAIGLLKSTCGAMCLAFTDSEDWSLVTMWMNAGGAGYIPKRASQDEIVRALRHIIAGGTYVSPMLRQPLQTSVAGDDTPLSRREREILSLLAHGYTGDEIAEQLCISPKTVETHRARIGRKLCLRTRHQLVEYAIREGLLVLTVQQEANGRSDN